MSEGAALQTQTTKVQPSNSHSLLVQRKCACGGSSGLTGSCSDCEKKKLLGKPLQTKLRINEPGDAYEQEADRVAEQVMRMAEPGKDTDTSKAATAPLVQRKVSSDSAGIGTAPPIVHDVLASPGQPLDAGTRTFFEPRFGHDFGHVRVHADTRAAESARSVNAQAYTVDHHVVLGAEHSVQHSAGRDRLLAHELTHTVQQQGENSWRHNDIAHEKPRSAAVIHSNVTALPVNMLCRQTLPSWATETFSRADLESYVDKIMKDDRIEGEFGSDNKARAYVQFSKTSLDDPPPQLRKLLILELLNGIVTAADQEAILAVLETSDLDDCATIFASGGVVAAELFSNITQQEQAKRLARFWARFTSEFTGEIVREHTAKTIERLESAIGDYEKAKRDNLVFAKSGPAWEDKLATVSDGKYKDWHDLWVAGDYNQFALKVASFQSARGVQEDDIDGVLGPQTWAWIGGFGEAVASLEKVIWPESEDTCTLAARERMFRGYRMATGETVEIPEDKSEKVASWILHSRSEHMKELPVEYRAAGSAGLAVYLGLGEFVPESDIWKGKLKPGAVLQVWGSRKNYDLMRAGTTSGEEFYGTNFVFVRYDTENEERMLTRHMGRNEWKSKDDYEVWIAANMITLETELPRP